MKEKTTVRENLMTQKGYTPYCGDYNCSKGMPRTKFDEKQKQFVCSCGFISEFPKDFIKRYLVFRNKK